MSDDVVKRICQQWVDDGRADECFWEGWPECPTPEDSLTPRMVLDRIEELEAKLAKAMQIIDAFIEDEGYVPKRVEKLYAELVPEEWDGDTWRS